MLLIIYLVNRFNGKIVPKSDDCESLNRVNENIAYNNEFIPLIDRKN